MGQPSSDPLANGASQRWCSPACFYSHCLFPHFFWGVNSDLTSSLAVMDFCAVEEINREAPLEGTSLTASPLLQECFPFLATCGF